MSRSIISTHRSSNGRNNKTAAYKPGPEWARLIWKENRRQLVACEPSLSWKTAALAFGVANSFLAFGDPQDLDALKIYFARLIDPEGSWKVFPTQVENGLVGLPLMILYEATGDCPYRIAAKKLVNMLMHSHLRTPEGTLPYNTATPELMVDSLGMVSPFLIRWAKLENNAEASELAINQITKFIEQCVDEDSGLPYHGYYYGGPYRLGLHAWGRGIGWYLLGLVETLLLMPADHSMYPLLKKAFNSAVNAMLDNQQSNGHWSWAVLQRLEPFDSSTTAMTGYCLIRAFQGGLLGEEICLPIERAIDGLTRITRPGGILDHSLAECRGLGKYPQSYGPAPWLQGFGSAFVAAAYPRIDHWAGLEKEKMNIVITGITGLRNRGVEALVVSVCEQLTLQLPEANIIVLTRSPEYDSEMMKHKHLRFVELDLQASAGRRFRLKRLLFRFIGRNIFPEPVTEAAHILRTASLVIASGGDIFSSDYGNQAFHLQPLEFAQRYGVPVIFLAQSIGPFRHPNEAQAFLRVANQSPLLTVREPVSWEYMTQDLGFDTSRIRQTADPAFLLPEAPKDLSLKLLCSYGIDPVKPLIAISPSQGISRFSGINPEAHRDMWCKLIREWVEYDPEIQFLIIPHGQESQAGNDDRIIATNILKALDYHPRVKIAGGNHSASEYKGMISLCQMVIAERMHAGIAGLSTGVCTILIGYSIKAQGVLKDVFGDIQESVDLLIPIQEFVACGIFQRVLRVWEKRNDISSKLTVSIPLVKARAFQNFELIRDIVHSSIKE